MLSTLQRQLIYQPTRVPQLPVSESGCRPASGEDLTLRTADGLELHGWHLMPAPLQAETSAEFDRCLGEGRKVILFFHGNGGHGAIRMDSWHLEEDDLAGYVRPHDQQLQRPTNALVPSPDYKLKPVPLIKLVTAIDKAVTSPPPLDS